MDKHLSSIITNLAYQVELENDFDSGEVNCTDYWTYAVKFRAYDKDNLLYNIAMSGETSVENQHAMMKEI